MARLLGIDYGGKRTGIAVTDPLQIIASALTTVPTSELIDFLQKYCQTEEVTAFVLGYPKGLDGKPTDATAPVEALAEKLRQLFPTRPVHLQDERYTSRMAVQSMIASGMKKKDRRMKGNVDKISAVLILQSFMETQP